VNQEKEDWMLEREHLTTVATERLTSAVSRVLILLPVIGSALVAIALPATPARAIPSAPDTSSATEYSLAVTRICGGALLFDHAHDMGTRADALAVARDIRASTARRLAKVVAVPVPRELRRISRRWIASQRRLAASFARTWVEIYDTIDAAKMPAQRAALPRRLHELVHAPDPLRLVAGRLELELHVPDCTGD
jgi:hypothetical protein